MVHIPAGELVDGRARILLLDDDEDFCFTIQSLLELEGFKVTVVHRGVEGVKEILERDFEAIVCDMNMPTMPGDMFYLAVQRLKPNLCSRFIFVTGERDSQRINDFLATASGFKLYKPLSPPELVGRILDILDSNEAKK